MSVSNSFTRTFYEVETSSTAFWDSTAAEREQTFAILREQQPVSWQPVVEDTWYTAEGEEGYWAVVRHADIVEVSRRSDVFISGRGTQLETLPEIVEKSSQSIVAMDDPEHAQIRKLISAAFTPRQVRRIEDQIKTNATAIFDQIADTGEAEFVSQVSALMPMRTVLDMIGVDRDEQPKVAKAAEVIAGFKDPGVLEGRIREEYLGEVGWYLTKLSRKISTLRREEPTDDLMSALVSSEIDGRGLTDLEISSFFTLLCVAGTDTTRHTTTHAVKALTDFPDQRAWLAEDFEGRIDTAIEEFVRWATPVMTFARTAAIDVELGGQQIKAGDKVVVFYASGNWDTTVFENPEKFDLSRKPNPHLGFGGGGAHYCLGSQLAKSQLRAVFRELFTRIPDFEAGEANLMTTTTFIHGVKSMPITFTPEQR